MISVIVPIYNVEPYLRQCIDSIIHQTYTDLEIILVDDGSTDGSGEIADSYDDPRIKVFHTENRGLSAARNLGIDHAHGEYISFVDADDWIEPDLFLQAVSQICDADILCFGYNNKLYEPRSIIGGLNALQAFINDLLPGTAWCMLCKKECYSNLRFPEGRIHEDTATTYKLFYQSTKVICINKCGYHYRSRDNSLTHIINMNNLIDFWIAHKERFDYCKNIVDTNTYKALLHFCAFAISRAWALKNCITSTIPSVYYEMASFSRMYFPLSFSLPLRVRIGITFAKHPYRWSFWLANKLLIIGRKLII